MEASPKKPAAPLADDVIEPSADDSEQAVLEALERRSSRYTSPPIPVDDILRRHTAAMPQFVAAITARRALDGRLPSEGAG